MKYENCPKCEGKVVEKYSNGGFAIYSRLECEECGKSGGRVRVYEGESQRVEKQIRERFYGESTEDDCTSFINSI